MKSFAPITLALAAFSTLSLASPAGTRTAPRGRAVEVNAFLERSLLAARDEDAHHSAGPHHKGALGKVRRHAKEAAKYKRSRGANRKRQDCDDEDEDEDDGSEGDNSSYSPSSSAPAAASPTPQSYSSSASYNSGSGSGNKANEGSGSGSQSPSVTTAVTSSGSSSSSGSYDSSIPQSIQGTITGGQATYYFQGGAAGSCGNKSQDSDKVVAVSAGVMTSSLCGKTVQITNTANSKSVTATIQDTCPGCDTKHLDLSQGAYDAIGEESTGVLNVKWTITG